MNANQTVTPAMLGARRRQAWLTGLPLLAGWLLLYAPTYVNLARTLWISEEYAFGPIIGCMALGIMYMLRRDLQAARYGPATMSGCVILLLGLLMQVAGRVLVTPPLEIASQIPVAAGIILFMHGPAALRIAWFPVGFLVFMVPMPGIMLNALTANLKEWISIFAEEFLYAIGYPVARDGVLINIGQYQLFVGDACAGLHSMFSLSALGVLFVYLSGRTSLWHNAILISSILPVAFMANLARVLLLLLATYYLGDASARWLHGTAGLSVFVAELLLLLFLDRQMAMWRVRRGREWP